MRRLEAAVAGNPSVAEFEQIVAVCDGFEAKWRSGQSPRIEELIAQNPWLPRPALFRELLGLELELKQAAGCKPTVDEYRERFPALNHDLEEVFAENGPDTCRPETDPPGAEGQSAASLSNARGFSFPVQIGRYTVLELIGEGGQGQVFRVVHPGLGQDLVLKLSTRPVAAGAAERGLISAEGRLLAALDHRNLVRVLDLDVHEDGRPFLVMEYVAGRTLDQYIKHGLPGPRRAALMVAEIARAVGYVHDRGVVHQDIKPRNVLIDESGRPRLIDFGLARFRHAWADETLGPSGGTLLFMAPEQARGEVDRVGPAADIHALGGLLYFLLTGRLPVAGGSRSLASERVRRGAVNVSVLRSSAAPRRLRRICLKALSPEPGDRHATADELAEQLEHVARRTMPTTKIAALALVSLALLSMLALKRGSEQAGTPPAVVGTDRSLIQIVRRGRPMDLRAALPLRSGDQLWISCQVPHGTHASMFWLDSEGVLTELSPEIVTGQTADSLRYPPSGANDVVRLQGPPGTEFVLVCARRDKPVVRHELEALVEAGRPLPPLPESVIIHLGPDGVEAMGTSGPRSISVPVPSDLSAALGPLRMLQSKLRAGTFFLSGIAFPHVAD